MGQIRTIQALPLPPFTECKFRVDAWMIPLYVGPGEMETPALAVFKPPSPIFTINSIEEFLNLRWPLLGDNWPRLARTIVEDNQHGHIASSAGLLGYGNKTDPHIFILGDPPEDDMDDWYAVIGLGVQRPLISCCYCYGVNTGPTGQPHRRDCRYCLEGWIEGWKSLPSPSDVSEALKHAHELCDKLGVKYVMMQNPNTWTVPRRKLLHTDLSRRPITIPDRSMPPFKFEWRYRDYDAPRWNAHPVLRLTLIDPK